MFSRDKVNSEARVRCEIDRKSQRVVKLSANYRERERQDQWSLIKRCIAYTVCLWLFCPRDYAARGFFRKKYVAIFYCFGLVLFSDDALVFFRLIGVIVIAFTITIRYYHCYYRYIYRDFHYYFILSSSPLSS